MPGTNTPPSGDVSLTGSAFLQGSPLVASVNLSDPDGLGTLGYQWQRGDGSGVWTDVGGATGASYTPGQVDVGRLLRLVVSYTDGGGTAESVASDATPAIGNVNDAPAGLLVISGFVLQGRTLTATSSVTDADGLGAFSYRWQRDEGVAGWQDIAGAVSATYVPVQADVAHRLRAVVDYTDQQGTAESVVSSVAGPVGNVNDAPTGGVAIAGSPVQGQVVTVVDTLDDPDGLGDVSYTWQRGDGRGTWTTIGGATEPGYVPVQADVGLRLRVVASYTDGFGAGESVASAASVVVGNVNDAPSGVVTVAGVPQQGGALVAGSAIVDPDGVGTISYSWQRYDGVGAWSVIAGAVGPRYVPVQADVGHFLRAVASYVDGGGTAEQVASEATDYVANVNDPATGVLTVSGVATQGQRLTGTVSVSDLDGVPAGVMGQWQRLDAQAGWLDIVDARGTGYTLTQADVGHQVRLSVGFTDLLGADEFLASAPTGVVANVNDAPTGGVAVAGSALVGQALTATNTLDDPDGMTDPVYAWQRNAGPGWVTIAGAGGGANGAVYAPGSADVGARLRVVASYVDQLGMAESVASAATVVVGAVPAGAEAALALFDAAWYLAAYPDVAAAGVNPFQHYLEHGWLEGRDPSGLFHTSYYLNQNPGVAASGVNPLVQFGASGWAEGRDPSVGFSVSGYLAANPDVRAAGVNPLLHYVLYGRGEGRAAVAAVPHGTGAGDPLVDAAFYYAAHPEVAAAGLDAAADYHASGWMKGWDPDAWFHTTYYLNQNPDVRGAGIDPLAHFESYGWAEGRDPSVGFSVSAYLAANPDVRGAGVNPLAHYVRYGRGEGRGVSSATPHVAGPQDPLIDASAYYGQNLVAAAAGVDATADYHAGGWRSVSVPGGWFDQGYYLAANPDVRAAGVDPLLHYETSGWMEGRAPSLAFSPAGYLAANPDVAAAGVEPLQHWVLHGRFENRVSPLPGGRAAADPLVDVAYYDRQLGATLLPSGAAAAQQAAWSYDQGGWQRGLNPDAWFDTAYYLEHNPDIAAAHINPLLHYENYGWREGRDPSAAFSTNRYLAAHSDVRAAGVDPLQHWVEHGQFEGRAIFPV